MRGGNSLVKNTADDLDDQGKMSTTLSRRKDNK